jgi:hypothetical protein
MKRGNRGQFYLITSLLVFIIITAAVASIYSSIRYFEIERSEKVYIEVGNVNADLKKACGFALAYYCSILQVTGNTAYARELTTTYFSDFLVYISEKNPAFGLGLSLQSLNFNVTWFARTSFSELAAEINYTLPLYDWGPIEYETKSRLTVEIQDIVEDEVWIQVSKDEMKPVITLGRNNFKLAFFNDSAWQFITPSREPTVYANGTYVIPLPAEVDPDNFFVAVEDDRGIIVVAANRESYVYNFLWDGRWTGESSYLMVELLQSGEMRVLGENLQFSTAKPLLPLPVRALRLNLTVNGLSREVPFQIEDWESDGMIPLGLTSNSSLISHRTMLVFLVNSGVSQATLWWNASDAAAQTPYAYTNLYFTGDNPVSGILTNGRLVLKYLESSWLTSLVGTTSAKAEFMRINNIAACYGSAPAVIIHHGIIRDIIQQEAEWPGGIANCPDVYSQIVITLPANCTYYTYQLRLIFANTTQPRTVNELRLLTLSYSTGTFQTENGITAGDPVISTSTGLFYNLSSVWQHHFTQRIYLATTKGAGIMFTSANNLKLYYFDTDAVKTGALSVSSSTGLSFLPVSMSPVSFQTALDIAWYGAVATFNGDTPIYSASGKGLWLIAEYPPVVELLSP